MKKLLLNSRSALALSHDILAAALSWYAAFLLRFNFNIPLEHSALMISTVVVVLITQATSFIFFGLYRGTWRFASLMDLKRILISVIFSSIALTALLFMIANELRVPRSVLILDPILLLLIMGGSRVLYRGIMEHQLYGPNFTRGESVVIFGAGAAAITLIKDLMHSNEWRVVGMLDDDESVHGREILGIKVHGGMALLPRVIDRFDVRHAIIAMPSATHQERRRVLNLAKENDLNVLTVPGIDDLMSGRLSVSQIRRVDVEDLLGRDSVELDSSGLENLISNQIVMVSGAGGSIGSELCRQISKFKPRLLICLDISEYSLYILEQSLISDNLKANVLYIVADVKHELRLRALISEYKPSVVFHAAAYKHVPLMERDNVTEALSNNVLGTYYLAKVCQELAVSKFVLVSTDKAVNPTNVMGASKRLAEMVCQGLQKNNGTKFVMVRFGNVLASSGSVIPKFRQQISEGGPVTVTHPEITRYFMSIPEASQLVMQAGLMGQGGEIFLLDMGEPVKIVDLAQDMIKLSGFLEGEIAIEFTGLRPGEKLFEELLADDECSLPTTHPKVRVARARSFDAMLMKDLLSWVGSSHDKDENILKKELSRWVEEYSPDFSVTDKK